MPDQAKLKDLILDSLNYTDERVVISISELSVKLDQDYDACIVACKALTAIDYIKTISVNSGSKYKEPFRTEYHTTSEGDSIKIDSSK